MGCADMFSAAKQEKKVGRPPALRIHLVSCDGDVALCVRAALTRSPTRSRRRR